MRNTPKQKQKHEEHPPLGRSSFYHSHLVSSPVTNSLHLLVVKDVCVGLYYYIFIHIFMFFSLQLCFFLHLLSQKNTTFTQMHKNGYIMTVHDIWPELLLWTYCFVHWVMFWCHQHTGGVLTLEPCCWWFCTPLKMFDLQLKPSSAFQLWLIVQRNWSISNSFWDTDK